MDTAEVMERLRKSLAAHSLVLIRKEFLDRAGWEEGMRVFGRTPQWAQFPLSVVSSQSISQIPPALAERIAEDDMRTATIEPVLEIDGNYYRPVFIPIQDVGRRDVANVVLLVDVSQEINTARFALLLGGMAYLAGGVLLFVLFYYLVGWIGRRIEQNEQRLEQLASVDQLTGLYNRRMYHSILAAEIARAQRYDHPLSILMLDIDHFKHVNDNYGHVTGDRILERLGRLLTDSVRGENIVCRYGGEEFTIIVPELGAEAASEMAERLREIVEQTNFDSAEDRKFKITISIGVAAFPDSGYTVEQLTRAADIALYAAKESGRNRVTQYKKRHTRSIAQQVHPD